MLPADGLFLILNATLKVMTKITNKQTNKPYKQKQNLHAKPVKATLPNKLPNLYELKNRGG